MPTATINTVTTMLENLPEDVQQRAVEHLREYLEEVTDEMRWDQSFQKTSSKLSEMARKARMEKKIKLKPETYECSLEIQRIGNLAVRRAQEENRRLGLPNVYSRNNKLIYEMPDGTIIVKDLGK